MRITATPTPVSQPFVLECPAAVALALWERHSVQPLARRLLGAPVARIDHVGSFACRNIGGEAGGRRSEHASANALDVAGFVLANGRTIRVARDWGADNPRGRFLREVHARRVPVLERRARARLQRGPPRPSAPRPRRVPRACR